MKCKDWLNKHFHKAAYIPITLMTGGGIYTAWDTIATSGPEHLAAGGILLTALALTSLDSFQETNYASRALSRIFRRQADNPVTEGSILAVLGLATCAAFTGGDIVYQINQHGFNPQELARWETIKKISSHPETLSITAGVPFAIASVMDFPSVYQKVSDKIGQRNTMLLQSALSITGSLLIGAFGFRARMRPIKYYGLINAKTDILTTGHKIMTAKDKMTGKDNTLSVPSQP